MREDRLKALVTIVDYSYANTFRDLLKKLNIPISFISHGYGSAKSEIYDILGFGSPKKIVAVSIVKDQASLMMLNEFGKKLNFDKKGTGIAFTIGMNSVSSHMHNLYKNCDMNIESESEADEMEASVDYSLLITIVESGHFDMVMESAKKAGASGGTLVHARGLGSKEAEKFLGITIQPEKDIVLIIAPNDKKTEIMQSITKEAGLNKEGRGICFSLPVSEAIGLIENTKEQK
ncbi:MAG: P-II family nitrogen regulator [Clostridia bacterium]|jgi:nitrogen regulatory protein PII